MPYRQYTKCYDFTPGDKPFNKEDLIGFVLGSSAPGLIVAFLGFLSGSMAGYTVAFIAIAIQYAATIVAVADQWLYHRLVCVSGDRCAVGKVEPIEPPSTLGEFDNDQYFDIRLMPHRHADEYVGPNTGFFTASATPGTPAGTPVWSARSPVVAGPSLDGKTATHPGNDIFRDSLQGDLVRPSIRELPYVPVDAKDAPVFGFTGSGVKVTRCTLHCEAEGNFWQAMKDYAPLQGAAVGAGAAGGAAAGCAIGGIFGPIGCLIGAIVGGLLGGGAAAYVGANTAFNSDPGRYEDANVGDQPLGDLHPEDLVVVYGTHVYDGFHEGWHEFHPLKAVMRFNDRNIRDQIQYLEWNPDATTAPAGLTVADMRQGLDSPAFAAAARKVRDQWCAAIGQAFDPGVVANQRRPEHRWTIHPLVDGCDPGDGPPPPH